MEVVFEAEAKKWIESKGSHLTVKNLEVHSCCAPDIQEAVAIPTIPKDIHNYNVIKTGNISIYVQKTLKGKETITLRISGFSFFKTISATLQ